MKRMSSTTFLIALILLLICAILLPKPAYAETAELEDNEETIATYDQEDMEQAYKNVINYANNNGIDIGMTFADFVGNYNGQDIGEFEEIFYSTMNVDSSSVSPASSGGNTYYYNTGNTRPAETNYSKYNLLDIVKKGDIIYEANGFYGLTGHIAVVVGIYSDTYGREYIRLIEAIPDYGVVRSILDDTRVDEQGVTILRVKGATTVICNRVVNFCVNQLGKSYNLDFAKNTSASETSWYCSELVWAAYYNEDLDVEVEGNGEPGVTPRDILNSAITTAVAYGEPEDE